MRYRKGRYLSPRTPVLPVTRTLREQKHSVTKGAGNRLAQEKGTELPGLQARPEAAERKGQAQEAGRCQNGERAFAVLGTRTALCSHSQSCS